MKFLFGCETELNKHLTLGISKEKFQLFDFVIIPTTHFHMKNFTLSKEETSGDMNFSDEEELVVLRPYKFAKRCGCKFYLGSDAHRPSQLDNAKAIFERAIDLLKLTEDDKFIIGSF